MSAPNASTPVSARPSPSASGSGRETAHASARNALTLASIAQSVLLSSSPKATAAANVIARGSKRREPRSSFAPAAGEMAGGASSGHALSAQRYTSTWVTL